MELRILIFAIVAWVGLSLGVSAIASQRERDHVLWFLISLVTSPVLAILMLIALPQQSLEVGSIESGRVKRVKCDQCAELILPDAKRCRFCGASRVPTEPLVERKTSQSRLAMTRADVIAKISLSVVAAVFILVALWVVWSEFRYS